MYPMTGMPILSASSVGVLKASASIKHTAMPSTLSAIAVCIADTISATVEDCEPVHW